MVERLPLSALLSQALVAFIIEFDNEFEHLTPHRTTNHGSRAGAGPAPWLVSMAMWIKFLRFVPDNGIIVREFQNQATLTNQEMKTWLTRLSKWWGYVLINKSTAEDPFRWVVRPTSGGQRALQVWRPLTGVIEKRWEQRFGKDTVGELRQSLQSLVARCSPDLPDFLPILGYDMMSRCPDPECLAGSSHLATNEYEFPILLSKVLLALAIQYERESRLSLAISANVLRLANEKGTRIRDFPRLSGVSKEGIEMAVKRLQASGLAVVQTEAQGRAKVLTLTAKGEHARDSTIASSGSWRSVGKRAAASSSFR